MGARLRMKLIDPETPFLLDPSKDVKVTIAGEVIEVTSTNFKSGKKTIISHAGGNYTVTSSGEERAVTHHDNRSENYKNLYKTFNHIRGLVNANVTNPNRVRWCTLTYADNMTDTSKLSRDFVSFQKRFYRYCKANGYYIPEYIAVMEPQERGAWHVHIIYIWKDMTAPYIPHDDFEKIWGNGFVNIKSLSPNMDSVTLGAYLTAHLRDTEDKEPSNNSDETASSTNKKHKKGGRLHLYPTNFHIVRHSQGVSVPISKRVSQDEKNQLIRGKSKIYEAKLSGTDGKYELLIMKEQYS